MMTYLRVRWVHDSQTDPIWLYSELDEYRWEVRKVEVFRNGSFGFASKPESKGTTRLGLEPIPRIEEIALDDQFEVAEITRDEFEDKWERALVLTK
jgi:hypothetical protein